MATTLIVKNPGAGVVKLPGTGLQIAAGSQDDYTGQISSILKIASSLGVRTLVAAGTIVINNGSADLSPMDAHGYLDGLWSSSAQQNIGLLPRGYISGARLTYINVQSVSVGEAGKVSTLVDSEGNFPLVFTGALVADLAVAGPGGLQTGQVEAANTWYEVLVIGSSTGAQPTALLLVPAGVAFNQANYDLKRRVGYIRNNAISALNPFYQVGDSNVRTIAYDMNGLNLNLVFGSATVFTDIDCTSLVPPKGRTKITISMLFRNLGGAGTDELRVRPKGSVATGPPFGLAPGILLTSFMLANLDVFTGPNQFLQYKVTQAADIAAVGVVAYEDEL